MSAFSDALAVLDTNLGLAATDLAAANTNRPAPQVVGFEPDAINGDHIAYWVADIRPSETIGETLGDLSLWRGVFIRGVLWRGASNRASQAALQLEADIADLAFYIWKRLYADRGLGGNAAGLYIADFSLGWIEGEQNARTCETTAYLDMSESFIHAL